MKELLLHKTIERIICGKNIFKREELLKELLFCLTIKQLKEESLINEY